MSSSVDSSFDVAIIGAGPVGLFAVFELGLLGLKAVVIDTLDRPGGQCAELYPEKPIYDIPAYPVISGQELTDKLLKQIAPFSAEFCLSQRVENLCALDGVGEEERKFQLTTSEGRNFTVSAVFIAAGAGSFTPRKLKIPDNKVYENRSLFYAVRKKDDFAGRDLIIVGGGDSALDWTLELLDSVKSLTLIHRSKKFRAQPASIVAVERAVENGQMLFIEGELAQLHGADGFLETVDVKVRDGIVPVKANRLLAFFGLNIELGSLADWGYDLQDGKQIKVDTEKFQTSISGVFAVGDINCYPGKLKLILSGFHECALAAHAAFKFVRPNEKLRFQYTTSSTELQKRLQIS
jgi:thioredoxin reductase (NADPH)